MPDPSLLSDCADQELKVFTNPEMKVARHARGIRATTVPVASESSEWIEKPGETKWSAFVCRWGDRKSVV